MKKKKFHFLPVLFQISQSKSYNLAFVSQEQLINKLQAFKEKNTSLQHSNLIKGNTPISYLNTKIKTELFSNFSQLLNFSTNF